jgi:amidophosphoribosyltransferase
MAVYRQKDSAAQLVHRGLFALQHRGQEAAGIACSQGTGELQHLRGRGLVVDALPMHRTTLLRGNQAVGHVRYSTVTAERTENMQPFVSTTPFGPLAICHNGNLKNAAALRQRLEASGALLSTTMDTELLVHLLARSGAKDFATALQAACAEAVGAYSLTLLCDGRLYGFRDAYGVRPLVLGKLADGWAIASETCALQAIGATYEREVRPGELLEIGPHGLRSQALLPPQRPAPCIFELVYFSRPDSQVFGQSVHQARTRMGEALANQDALLPAHLQADMVVPIPDSGFPAAIGYARRSGLPLEKAIIRSHYIGRTFILPDQDSREHSLHLKLSVIAEVVRGKKVLLVDDSIVRGNTSRLIVQMVRDAGATEVGMRIASPPLSWPCYLGIDTPTRAELIINQHPTSDGVRRFIGANSLTYLSVEALLEATGRQPFCTGCMDGAYPV